MLTRFVQPDASIAIADTDFPDPAQLRPRQKLTCEAGEFIVADEPIRFIRESESSPWVAVVTVLPIAAVRTLPQLLAEMHRATGAIKRGEQSQRQIAS